MRIMAECAIFLDRWMFPEERASFLGMAVIAGFIDRVFNQKEVVRRTVRIMAIAADHFGFPDRVSGTQVALRFFLDMTAKADFGLRRFVEYRVMGCMYGMTGGAGQIRGLMDTALPMNPVAAFMAS